MRTDGTYPLEAIAENFPLRRGHRELRRGVRVLVVGDLMLDVTIWGSCRRVAAEAPVPVLTEVSRSYEGGGAARVAAMLASLGADVTCCGLVGQDAAGEQLERLLRDQRIDVRTRRTPRVATTVRIRGRTLADPSQLVYRHDVEPGSVVPSDELVPLLPTQPFEAICVADHGKGVISREMIEACLRRGAPLLADPAPGAAWGLYAGALLIKCNAAEDRPEEGALVPWRVVTGDRGGLTLHSYQDNEGSPPRGLFARCQHPQRVLGAGDQVLATLAVAISSGFSLPEAVVIANQAAAEYCAGHAVTMEKLHAA